MLDAARDHVLARNNRYVHGVIERYSVCPFARSCRAEGRLWRRICWTDDADVARVMAGIDELEAVQSKVEVALMIFPGVQMSARQFDAYHQRIRARYLDRSAGKTFYVVPFHPDYPRDASSAGALVRFWRKSPDPTLQFVHIDTLEALRRVDPKAEFSRIALRMLAGGHSAEDVLAALEAKKSRPSTSQQVADQNLQRFRELGAATFEQALDSAAELERLTIDPAWPDTPWMAAE